MGAGSAAADKTGEMGALGVVDIAQATEQSSTGFPGKVLTLHQPWASLIAIGVKTMETRSWSTSYRGPLTIHAGMASVARTLPDHWVGEYCVGQTTVGETRHTDECACPDPDDGQWDPRCEGLNEWVPGLLHDEGAHGWTVACELSFGAIVATCELVDVAPIVGPDTETPPCVVVEAGGRLSYWSGVADLWSVEQDERDVTSERPYGHSRARRDVRPPISTNTRSLHYTDTSRNGRARQQ